MKTTTSSTHPARTLLLVDCDERTEAMLCKSLQRLGIAAEALRQDQGSMPPGIVALIVELDDFESPNLLAQADAAGLPIIALSHHETLSQIQCAIRMGATAMLNKPITQTSVYTTLMMAQGLRNKLSALESDNSDLYSKLKARPLIAKSIARLMLDCGINEDEAFERVRTLSMTLNQSIEAICHDIENQSRLRRQGS
ncbi:response regulator [Marinobacter vulgaris]|uniref:Response regulator n=1 Tax=Marinobacter vulgaris TaxID=1928331 RepID=A0A2V3ZF87_9GAMM|nr:ANTAR domain-containing protein [Marinobacter vulgaris]PXX89122.1 response regulator [Marinobacter vulgaris]TSJ67436.1 ANTAR domain-containing protein [Marinobacter vulgaris]